MREYEIYYAIDWSCYFVDVVVMCEFCHDGFAPATSVENGKKVYLDETLPAILHHTQQIAIMADAY